MTKVSNQVAAFVRQRADNRCEYCQSHQDLMMSKLQIDHILPVAKGGSNDEANLSLAYDMCNGYKWQKVGGVDPISGSFVTIFNPRQQQWQEHFEWGEDGDEVIGLTPCGRVTVSELKMNNSIALTVRRHWIQAGWHPPQE